MTWKVDLVVMLRSLVGDLDQATFTDERLRQVITVGAYNVLNDADFSNDYVVSISSLSISPDPISEKDTDFSVLSVYKAACILLGSEVKTEAANAISIKDGPSSIDLRGVSGSLSGLYKDLCEKYDELLQKYRYEKGSGSGTPAGTAVLGPYSPASWGVAFNENTTRY